MSCNVFLDKSSEIKKGYYVGSFSSGDDSVLLDEGQIVTPEEIDAQIIEITRDL